MAIAKDVLDNKGKMVYSLSPQATILDALKLMADKKIGVVLVMEENKVKGIFSERDYARRGMLMGHPESTPLKEVMTGNIYYVSPNETLECCLAQMSDKHIRHLPVIEKEKLLGLISIGDVINLLIQDQKELIAGLENSILVQDLAH
jgi:CBS domain-containing protein